MGAWPISAERLQEYMQKAMREAKERTSWVANNAEFESALNAYIDAMIGDAEFVADLEEFVEEIAEAGRINSLAQTLMKYTAPGVPDLYQGGELWDLSPGGSGQPAAGGLWAAEQAAARDAGDERGEAGDGARATRDCRNCGWCTRRLQLRQGASGVVRRGCSVCAAAVEGSQAERVIAYLRGEDVLTVVPRLVACGGGDGERRRWQAPEGRWRNRLTGADGWRVDECGWRELLESFRWRLLRRGKSCQATRRVSNA